MLLCNTVAPLTANALLLSDDSDSDSDGIFLPVPRQFFPTSYDSMNTSIGPNRVQVSQRSNPIFTPIPHQLLSPSHPSMNTSISSPNNIQFLPSSDSAHIGSDSYYYNNFGSWANRTPYSFWQFHTSLIFLKI
jgi:hypothetical protein